MAEAGVILESTLTCPLCGHVKTVTMPADKGSHARPVRLKPAGIEEDVCVPAHRPIEPVYVRQFVALVHRAKELQS